jgi:hypothetical protein
MVLDARISGCPDGPSAAARASKTNQIPKEALPPSVLCQNNMGSLHREPSFVSANWQDVWFLEGSDH